MPGCCKGKKLHFASYDPKSDVLLHSTQGQYASQRNSPMLQYMTSPSPTRQHGTEKLVVWVFWYVWHSQQFSAGTVEG
jgi:hypothetical protein